MRFVKDYFRDEKMRGCLNELTRQIFGFDFKEWYQGGYYTGEYIPYSYEENGRIISNASANIMDFTYTDADGNISRKHYIQIGTVMTAPKYRNKGYAGALIKKIVEEYEKNCDGIYLFANLNAVDFYRELGFKQGLEYKATLKPSVVITKQTPGFVKIKENQYTDYIRTVKASAPNAAFEHNNKYGLQMFYTGGLDNVYYSEKLECYIAYEMDEQTLFLNSVISEKQVNIKEVLAHIEDEYKQVELGFTPRAAEQGMFDLTSYDGGSDYRFLYKGERLKDIERQKLCFPEYSHA